MADVRLSGGVWEYEDTGGSGPVLVLLPGLGMDGSVYRKLVPLLSDDYRCVVPTLPLGSHRQPAAPDADLSVAGLAELQAELLAALDLRDVTLVGLDSGAFQLTAARHPDRLARLVILPCEAFENFPPGLPGKNLALAARLPGGIALAAAAIRLRPLRRLPIAYGPMTKRPVPVPVTDRWTEPLRRPEIRRDLRRYLRSCRRGDMLAAAEELRSFTKPALVAWAAEDRMMPRAHADRFAALLPDARLVEIPDSSTLIPEDNPGALAEALRGFLAST